jgi:hypothetical protein
VYGFPNPEFGGAASAMSTCGRGGIEFKSKSSEDRRKIEVIRDEVNAG